MDLSLYRFKCSYVAAPCRFHWRKGSGNKIASYGGSRRRSFYADMTCSILPVHVAGWLFLELGRIHPCFLRELEAGWMPGLSGWRQLQPGYCCGLHCQTHDRPPASRTLSTAASWCSQLPQDSPCQSHAGTSASSTAVPTCHAAALHPWYQPCCHVQKKSFNGMPKINFPTESLSPELSVGVRCGLIFVFHTVCIFFLCKGILLLVHRLRCSCKQNFASDAFDHNFRELKSLNENS